MDRRADASDGAPAMVKFARAIDEPLTDQVTWSVEDARSFIRAAAGYDRGGGLGSGAFRRVGSV